MALATKQYQSISYISGPLLFLDGAKDLSYGAIVNIHLPDDTMRGGQVIEVSERNAVIQVFEETRGLDLARSSVSLREDVARLGVSPNPFALWGPLIETRSTAGGPPL